MNKRTSNKNSCNKDQSSKEQILQSAIKLFALRGYAATTVSEIVSAAKINLSMVSYYFGGKEALFLACLERAATQGIEDVKRLLVPAKNVEEFKVRLSIFVDDTFLAHVDRVYEKTLIRREFSNPSKLTKPLVEKTVPLMFRTVEDYFKAAQKNKILKADLDTNILTLLFVSTMMTITGEPELVKMVSAKGITDKNFRDSIIQQMLRMIEPFLIVF